jgi:hypothetical protein
VAVRNLLEERSGLQLALGYGLPLRRCGRHGRCTPGSSDVASNGLKHRMRRCWNVSIMTA